MLIIVYWHMFDCCQYFWHICNIKHRLGCKYSSQNLFNTKNFIPHKKPISLLNIATYTQSMQRTWWPVASTTIVTGSYCMMVPVAVKKSWSVWFKSNCNGPNHLTQLPFGFRTWLWWYKCLLSLISMLWQRQVIFKSKGDKLSSLCWMQDLNWTARPYDQLYVNIYMYIQKQKQ